MTEKIRQLLRCPGCGGDLMDQLEPGKPDSLLGFRCPACAHLFPVRGGVPRMVLQQVEQDEVAQSFGFQWACRESGRFERDTLYGLTMQEEQAAFLNAYGLLPEQLRGKTVLDAGCGDGALLDVLSGLECELVGMDISTAITVPHQRCEGRPNVTVVQADVCQPCFAPGSFDFVWCEGVVVHTPDPVQAFCSVSRLVRPGGHLYVWVYPSDRLSIYQRTRDLLIAPYRVPRSTLVYLCYLLGALFYPALRLARRRSLSTIAFELFDNLSPRYQWRCTEEQVCRWFHEAGFVDLRISGHIGVSGRRAV